jgi:dynein heavy chain
LIANLHSHNFHAGTLDENSLTTSITMNYYMDSASLQARIDGSIDKRSGRVFGPPTGKRMIFYIDGKCLAAAGRLVVV